MSQVIGDDFVSRLLQGDEGEGKQAWAEFLFNIPLARSFLTHVPKDTTTACLNQGIKWGGLGWTTSRASRVVYELTGVPLVTSRVEDYRDAFLFAIAMAKEVEINVLHLSDRASEAAYQLCAILCDTQWPYEEGVTSPEGTAPEAAKAKEETEDLAGLDWDEPSEELPKELLFIWEQVTQGKRKLELRQLLEGFPKFTGLPSKAPENNFRQDCHKATDKLAKTWQQSLLHLLRLQVVLYIGVQSGADPEEVKVLQQQVFQLSCEIYTKMNNWRKEASVPGCVPTGDTVLFDKEEMSTVTQVNKVNQMTRGRGTTTTFPQVFNQKIISTLVPGFSSSIKGRGFYPYTQNPYGRGRQTSMSLENCQDGSFKLKLFSGMVPRFYKSTGWPRKGGSPAYTKGGAKGRGLLQTTRGTFISTSLPQAKTKASVVDTDGCFQRAAGSVYQGHSDQPSCSQVPPIPNNLPLGKATGRSSAGRFSTKWLHGLWGSDETANSLRPVFDRLLLQPRHKISCTLVHCIQERGRRGKAQINIRLQKKKPTPELQNFQNGDMESDISILGPKNVGLQNRFKGCFLPSQPGKGTSKICKPKGGSKHIQIFGSPIWLKYFTRTLDQDHEGPSSNLEKERNNVLSLFRRHSDCKQKQNNPFKRSTVYGTKPKGCWTTNKFKKECTGTHSGHRPSGFPNRFHKGYINCTPTKTEKCNERLRENTTCKADESKKDGCHLRPSKGLLTGNSCLKVIYRPYVRFYKKKPVNRLGHNLSNSRDNERGTEDNRTASYKLAWKKFRETSPKSEIHSESSDFCWGGKDLKTGQIVTDYWRSQKTLHINIKELSAAVQVVKTLAKEGEHITLGVDNLIAYHYLRKGGRLPQFNQYMRELWDWCLKKNITLTPLLVPSAQDQADYLTRKIDKGDYTLNMDLFNLLKKENSPWINPDWDMFASQGNKKFQNYVTRYPFWECKKTDSLQCPLQDIK